MKLAFLQLNGFRGYRKPIRVEFGDRFTIIDGRNGVGKSTVFDAIEFALTGMLGKYDGAKASGQTVADYLWWTGEGPPPEDRYVEVGFVDGDETLTIRRGQFDDPAPSVIAAITERLCDSQNAPPTPLAQLCATAIIRDEHITKLSLDLPETDRYGLLRDALGANDADSWIERGAQVVHLAKKRTALAQQDVNTANAEVASTARRLDEARATLVVDSVLAEAVGRLRSFANSTVTPDQLAGPVRLRIADVNAEIEALLSIKSLWSRAETDRAHLADLTKAAAAADAAQQAAAAALQSLGASVEFESSSSLSAEAGNIVKLVALGRELGLRDGCCPLCAHDQTNQEFERGLKAAEDLARRLDADAVRAAELEQKRAIQEGTLAAATRAAEVSEQAMRDALENVRSFDEKREKLGIGAEGTIEDLQARVELMRRSLDSAQKDLLILETIRLSGVLEKAQRADSDAKSRLVRAQDRYGRTRKAEASAQALHDAARRAASETLDRRLDRVLPLMSELYRRLRPHPVWNDIEYSIRGDVRRFLRLQVGGDLNPQFIFSSGQRRATGLAFLLSVNLSLAWGRWRTILLDDPVQHIDDFRTVHLAELLAQLVSEGRQIICAVEDAALADLLCRRLPVGSPGLAKRVTLGPDAEGALAVLAERLLLPLTQGALVPTPDEKASKAIG